MNIEPEVQKNDPNNFELNVIDREKDSNKVDVEPTVEELNTLTHIPDRIPLAAWLIVLCELCERCAFYGMSGPFQNYIQFPVPGPNDTQAGALNRGQKTATLLTTLFRFFCNITPIAGAIIADQFWGKYKTVWVSCIVYIIGLLLLVLTSIPPSINAGVALPGLVIAMIIVGAGTGGVKSSVCPLMADQCTRKTSVVKGRVNCSLKKKLIKIVFFHRDQR